MSQPASAPANVSDAVKCDLAGEGLRSFGTLRFAATGWSMLPTIFPGDILMVERIDEDQVNLGDVILASRDGWFCAHRVVAKSEDCGPSWLTQGDAMAIPDRPVKPSEVLGRVAYVTRRGKRIALPAKLSVIESLIASLVRRSFFAARVLIYLHKVYLYKIDPNEYLASAVHTSKESITPCQG
jgi:hypothetical protein